MTAFGRKFGAREWALCEDPPEQPPEHLAGGVGGRASLIVADLWPDRVVLKENLLGHCSPTPTPNLCWNFTWSESCCN
ncbi:hypothetical protein CEXT_128131 [Caerostris extrusa]|uniref:Uncharacterized protein n=1 Tax=Caerostris extrusa TaxID=172846 RepID=A0AAV4P3G7_CAEEX|nr:hypothetical protein CEXT_128131 [Caerostris extrusa]